VCHGGSTNAASGYLLLAVSTFDQTTENKIIELRRYAETRGWTASEYVDEGVSGSTDHRPALDKLLRDAKRRRFDVLVCWRLDRMGRNLKHLILFLEELQALGVDFVSLAEGIDATTPAGRLQVHILGAIAEFERARIAERVRLGLARVRANGQTLGRPRVDLTKAQLDTVQELGIEQAAQVLGISRSTLYRRLSQGAAQSESCCAPRTSAMDGTQRQLSPCCCEPRLSRSADGTGPRLTVIQGFDRKPSGLRLL